MTSVDLLVGESVIVTQRNGNVTVVHIVRVGFVNGELRIEFDQQLDDSPIIGLAQS